MRSITSPISKFGRLRRRAKARNQDTLSCLVRPVGHHDACSSRLSDLPTEASDGSGYIHKAKFNCNGAFSVGKTWRMDELREVEVVNVSPLLTF